MEHKRYNKSTRFLECLGWIFVFCFAGGGLKRLKLFNYKLFSQLVRLDFMQFSIGSNGLDKNNLFTWYNCLPRNSSIVWNIQVAWELPRFLIEINKWECHFHFGFVSCAHWESSLWSEAYKHCICFQRAACSKFLDRVIPKIILHSLFAQTVDLAMWKKKKSQFDAAWWCIW